MQFMKNKKTPRGNPSIVNGCLVVASSMSQAEGITGLPKHHFQAMKEHGVPGFRGSRVYLLEVAHEACWHAMDWRWMSSDSQMIVSLSLGFWRMDNGLLPKDRHTKKRAT